MLLPPVATDNPTVMERPLVRLLRRIVVGVLESAEVDQPRPPDPPIPSTARTGRPSSRPGLPGGWAKGGA